MPHSIPVHFPMTAESASASLAVVPASMLTAPGVQELDESERVLLWRIVRLVQAGYDSQSAVDLALSPVDLHVAVDLRERGCPIELALRILD